MSHLNEALIANDGNRYSLNDFKGQPLILYFYPKNNTPGCTMEARDFTALAADFADKGYTVVGVSKDTPKSHQNFKEKHDLGIITLSDPDEVLIKAFDVLKEKTMYGKTFVGVERSTFILDENLEVVNALRGVKAKGHAEEVLRLL